MSRSVLSFPCRGEILAATLDTAPGTTGLLIVSGGNEIRSGAHGGMAELSQKLSSKGHPVLRFDRRGIGDSTGVNAGFQGSRDDIAAATKYFRQNCPQVDRIVAFGNCDAATALALFQPELGFDALCIANPWTIEQTNKEQDAPAEPSSAAIRTRYWERLKNPRTYTDLISGQINFTKLLKGLKKAAVKEGNSKLALDLRDALKNLEAPCDLLIAKRDTTALAFMAGWKSADYAEVRDKSGLALHTIDTASHGFADSTSKIWLEDRLIKLLSRI
ncbi:MAG: hydrolase 1, exosortase A system-associated [Pseudomonadota bacterium]